MVQGRILRRGPGVTRVLGGVDDALSVRAIAKLGTGISISKRRCRTMTGRCFSSVGWAGRTLEPRKTGHSEVRGYSRTLQKEKRRNNQ